MSAHRSAKHMKNFSCLSLGSFGFSELDAEIHKMIVAAKDCCKSTANLIDEGPRMLTFLRLMAEWNAVNV